jgi:uncharacterized protein YbbK (DUF523 family)
VTARNFATAGCLPATEPTSQFVLGAQQALELARLFGAGAAILQARSPSCGATQVYDGTFSGRLVAGSGIFAALLQRNGIPVTEDTAL